MIKFDRLMILTNTAYISNIQNGAFVCKKGVLIYTQEIPFHLAIKVKNMRKELVIEFTGKILGKRYAELISVQTIKQCFDNINALGICYLDYEKILNDGEVTSCDITTDVECTSIKEMNRFMRNNMRSYRLFDAKLHKNGNLEITKIADTNEAWKKLTVYNKETEMGKSTNRSFREAYDISPLDFQNKCRFEIRVNSEEQVRQTLRITNAILKTVLSAKATPLYDFADEVLAPNTQTDISAIQQYRIELILKDCDYDMQKVEATLKDKYAEKTGMTKILNPYREALNRRNNPTEQNEVGWRDKIMGMLVSN